MAHIKTTHLFRKSFIDGPLFLAVFALVLPVFCFGQAGADIIPEREDASKTEKVKMVRTYTSEAGLKKMRPFNLTRELYFDELGRVQKEIGYTYKESIFGTDSVITTQEYTYAPGSKAVVFMKKTFLTIENKERYQNEVGYEYDQDGAVNKILLYQPDGTVKEAENPLTFAANNLNGLTMGSHARGVTVPKPVHTGNSSQTSPTQTHYSAGPNYGSLLSPPKEQEEIVITKEVIANGYVVKEETKSGKVLSEKRVLLNDKGLVSHLVTSVGGLKGNPKTVSIENFVYNNAGKETGREILGPDGKLILKYAHTYNAQEKLEQTVLSEKKDKVKQVMKFEYEFY